MKNRASNAQCFVPALSVLSLAIAGLAHAQDVELNPVVVTATKYAEDTQLIPAFVSIITRDQIQQSGVSTVSEAVMRLAGVVGTQSLFGGNEQSLDLMGFGDTALGNTVYVVDGVPVREGDQSEVRLSSIPISSVERIEVQRGGAGVLYGEGATAGVVNIITRSSAFNSPSKKRRELTAAYGSHGTSEIRGAADYANESIDLGLSVQKFRSDGYRQNSKSDQSIGLLSFKYTLDEHTRMGLALQHDNTHAETPGSLTLQEFDQNPQLAQAASLQNKTYMNAKTDRYAVFVESDLQGFKARFDAAERQRHYDSIGVLYGSRSAAIFESDNHFYGLTVRKTQETQSLRSTTLIGLESNYWGQNRIYPTQPNWGVVELSSRSNALYVKNDLDFKASGTRLSVGIRREKFDRNQLFGGDNTEMHETTRAWELGVSQKLNSSNSVFARRSQSYRLPNLDELPTPIYVGLWPNSVAVPLVPQFEKTNEIGWKFNESRTTATVRLYASDLSNEIVYDPSQGGNMNLPRTRRQGLDAYVRLNATRDLVLTGAYSHRVARFVEGVNNGNVLPMAPKNTLMLRGDWRFKPNQTVGLGVSYVGGQYIAGDFVNQNRMPSYRVVDARYAYEMKSADLSFVVRNLANAKYYAYATTTGGYSVYPDAGRTCMLTLKYKF